MPILFRWIKLVVLVAAVSSSGAQVASVCAAAHEDSSLKKRSHPLEDTTPELDDIVLPPADGVQYLRPLGTAENFLIQEQLGSDPGWLRSNHVIITKTSKPAQAQNRATGFSLRHGELCRLCGDEVARVRSVLLHIRLALHQASAQRYRQRPLSHRPVLRSDHVITAQAQHSATAQHGPTGFPVRLCGLLRFRGGEGTPIRSAMWRWDGLWLPWLQSRSPPSWQGLPC